MCGKNPNSNCVQSPAGTIGLLLLVSCSLVSFASTNIPSQPLPSTASIQAETIATGQPIDGNLYEFSYTLDCARELGFRSIVELLEEEDYPAALKNSEEKTSAGFPWSTETTNGYQYGFFAEALKGVCLEKMGEVVKAYRAYQNSRYYCDEDIASLSFPGPRLEVFVGIGRMCSMAGREYDALAYLDTARMEGSERPRIAVAADRAMITRAQEIGDYDEALILYEDLQTFTELTKVEYINYAQLNMIKHKNRTAFQLLTEGMFRKGIDNDQGVHDPLVDCFLAHMCLAEKEDIELFYYVLGDAVAHARALKGDEELLATLIQCRKVMCDLYPRLLEEKDIDQLKKRVAHLQTKPSPELLQRIRNQYKRKTTAVVKPRKSKKIHMPTERQENDIELLLMEAEYDRVNKNTSTIRGKYDHVLMICSNRLDESLLYDGTPIKLAAETGNMVVRTVELLMMLENQTAVTDSLAKIIQKLNQLALITHRNAGIRTEIFNIVTLYLERYKDPKWEEWLTYEYEILYQALPAYGMYNRILQESYIQYNVYNNNWEDAICLLEEMEESHPDMQFMLRKALGGFYAATGNPQKAFSIWLKGFMWHGSPEQYEMLCNTTVSWASEEERKIYPEVLKTVYFKKAIQNWPSYLDKLKQACEWNGTVGITLQMYDTAKKLNSTNLLTTVLKTLKQPGSLLAAARIYLKNGDPRNAAKYAFEALRLKSRIIHDIRPIRYITVCVLPTEETEILSICKNDMPAELRENYVQWLDTQQRQQTYPNIKQAYEKEYRIWKDNNALVE